jgi:hypothetical protein
MPEWREGVHRGIYRTLLAGAVLSGAYNEPFFKAEEAKGNGGGSTALANVGQSCILSAAELNYFEGFAAYNVASTADAEEAMFGPLGIWLVGDALAKDGRESCADHFANGTGRAALCQGEDIRCPIGRATDGNVRLSHSDAHLALLAALRMFWLVVHIQAAVARLYTPFDSSKFGASPWKWPARDEQREVEEVAPVEVPVVFFGVFQAEVVYVSRNQKKPYLLAFPLRQQATDEGAVWERTPTFAQNAGIHIRQTLRWIQYESGRPNTFGGSAYAPPLLLKFFEYLLREHFEMQFREMAFTDLWGTEQPFLEFIDSFKLFALEDVEDRGTGISDGLDEGMFVRYSASVLSEFRGGISDDWWF